MSQREILIFEMANVTQWKWREHYWVRASRHLKLCGVVLFLTAEPALLA